MAKVRLCGCHNGTPINCGPFPLLLPFFPTITTASFPSFTVPLPSSSSSPSLIVACSNVFCRILSVSFFFLLSLPMIVAWSLSRRYFVSSSPLSLQRTRDVGLGSSVTLFSRFLSRILLGRCRETCKVRVANDCGGDDN